MSVYFPPKPLLPIPEAIPDTSHVRPLRRTLTIVDFGSLRNQMPPDSIQRPGTPWVDITHAPRITMHTPLETPSPGLHTPSPDPAYAPRPLMAYPIPQQGEARIRPIAVRPAQQQALRRLIA